ncbi:MAG: ABC transporter ATP-binding protein [Bdellovibrionia bacterium]
MNQSILEVKNLYKKFGDFTAIDGLDLTIREGICFGLLGPNGAGKTTTIEIIEGINLPTSGEIHYRGKQLTPKGRKHFQERIGIQFQSTALPDRLRVGEVLALFSSFYKQTAKLDELIEWCHLRDLLKCDAGKLSGGQRQRLLLALSLVNDPDLIFLDEPTTGLDPQARRDFWSLIKSIKKKRKTIVLTTHYMDEAYELCDEIAIMNRGKVIAQGAPNHLLKEYFQGLSILIPLKDIPAPADQTLKFVSGKHYDREDCIEIQTTQVNLTLQDLMNQKVSLEHIQVRSRNLEDLFLELTQQGKLSR